MKRNINFFLVVLKIQCSCENKSVADNCNNVNISIAYINFVKDILEIHSRNSHLIKKLAYFQLKKNHSTYCVGTQ